MTVQGAKPQGSMNAHHLTTRRDPAEQNMMDQINKAREQMSALSSNKEMSDSSKKTKREELQQRINELNQQLQQYRANKQKEKAEEQARAARERAEQEALERARREAEGEADEYLPSVDPEVARSMLRADRAMEGVAEKDVLVKEAEADARIAASEFARDDGAVDLRIQTVARDTGITIQKTRGFVRGEDREMLRALAGVGSDVKAKYSEVLDKENTVERLESDLMGDLAEINDDINRTRARQAEKPEGRDEDGEEDTATVSGGGGEAAGTDGLAAAG